MAKSALRSFLLVGFILTGFSAVNGRVLQPKELGLPKSLPIGIQHYLTRSKINELSRIQDDDEHDKVMASALAFAILEMCSNKNIGHQTGSPNLNGINRPGGLFPRRNNRRPRYRLNNKARRKSNSRQQSLFSQLAQIITNGILRCQTNIFAPLIRRCREPNLPPSPLEPQNTTTTVVTTSNPIQPLLQQAVVAEQSDILTQSEPVLVEELPVETEVLTQSEPAVEQLPIETDGLSQSEPVIIEQLPVETEVLEPVVEQLPVETEVLAQSEPVVEQLPVDTEILTQSEPVVVEQLPVETDILTQSEPVAEQLPIIESDFSDEDWSSIIEDIFPALSPEFDQPVFYETTHKDSLSCFFFGPSNNCKASCVVNTAGSGWLTSSNYPQVYDKNLNCKFRIVTQPSNRKIRITFYDLLISANDLLYVDDEYVPSEFENNYNPPQMTSKNDTMIITFDSHQQDDDVKLKWKIKIEVV